MQSGAMVTARSCLLAGVLALSPMATYAEVVGRQLFAEPSPLVGLIAGTPDMPAGARQDLAMLVVEALADAYQAELQQAMLEFQQADSADRRRLMSWYSATAPILSELRATQAELATAQHVELHADRHNQFLLVIDARPLWISWPRISAQRRLERTLAAQFCNRHECPGDGSSDGVWRAADPSAVHGTWTLSQLHPPTWESADGLRCEFSDFSMRRDKETICRDLIVELHMLAAALRAMMRRGEPIEWSHLALRTHMSAAEQGIVVNRRGDYITVSVPALAANPIDWREARRWLEARAHDQTTVATIRRASPHW